MKMDVDSGEGSLVYINTYHIHDALSYKHEGVVVFKREYYLNDYGIQNVAPGKWKDQKPFLETSYKQSIKSKNQFKSFLEQPLFDSQNLSRLNNKIFTKLAIEFLTLENSIKTSTYFKAVTAFPISTKSDFYFNVYKNFLWFEYKTIVVHGKEYFFSKSGIELTKKPGTWNGKTPNRQESHGTTYVSEERFIDRFLSREFLKPKCYSSWDLNNNTFINLAHRYLTIKPFETGNKRHSKESEWYINRYHNVNQYYYGIVAFGKEYHLNEQGITIIKLGTWKDQKPLPPTDRYKTRKTSKDFESFLKQPLFDPQNIGRLGNKQFVVLAGEFLTLENSTQTKTYLEAVTTIINEEKEIEVYINVYNYIWPFTHSGIVAYGKEYFFSIDGVEVIEPGTWNGKTPISQKNRSTTKVSKARFMEQFVALDQFREKCYHFRKFNCNTFSKLAYIFLTEKQPFSTVDFIRAKARAAYNALQDNTWQRDWGNSKPSALSTSSQKWTSKSFKWKDE